MNPLEIDRDRLFSTIAACLCILAVGVVAAALESSLSTEIAPTPPSDSSTSGLSLLALLYLLLYLILSMFGGSLDGDWNTMSGTPNPIQLVISTLQLVYQYRFPLLVGTMVLAVLGLGIRRRHWIGSTTVLTPSDGATVRSQTKTTDDWPRAPLPNDVARSWLEMVQSVDIDEPRVRTPREWETAAIEAGFDPAAVRTITETFIEVQYGNVEMTPRHRTRVQKALRELTSKRNESDR